MARDALRAKASRLNEELGKCGRLAVAFSGGCDSGFLLASAVNACGRENVIALIADSAIFDDKCISLAADFCEGRDIPYIVTEFDPMSVPGFTENGPERCYFCKLELMGSLKRVAEERGFSVLADGTNASDDVDGRPGYKALQELGIASPLRDAGLTKAEIRSLSREMGLPTADVPSGACFATRIPEGMRLNEETVCRVRDAEKAVRCLFPQLKQLRVRIRPDVGSEALVARIEVDPGLVDELSCSDALASISRAFEPSGFSEVEIDPRGYVGD